MTSAPLAASHADATPAGLFTNGQLELLKWIAVVSMFIDHFGRHLFGEPQHSWAFGLGRLAFPLFVLVLACNLARPGDQAARAGRTAVRLAIACAISTPAAIWARGEPYLVNVFGTLGIGTALCWVLATRGHLAWRVPLCMLLCVGGHHVEFDVMGACLVPAIYLWRAQQRREAAAFAAVLLLTIAHLNGIFGGLYGYAGTFAVLPLAWAVTQVPARVPRMRWLFYAIYPLHLALIGALVSAGMGPPKNVPVDGPRAEAAAPFSEPKVPPARTQLDPPAIQKGAPAGGRFASTIRSTQGSPA